MKSADLHLLTAIAAGDRQAMTQLYEQYLPRLGRFLYRITQDRQQIDELINDVMLTVWQRAGDFRGESAVSTWILGIAYRKGRDATRSRKRYERLIREIPKPSPTEGGVSQWVASRDMERLMGDLSVEQRAVANLTFEFGYSYPEIAGILDISVNTVKTRMYYARKKMQAKYTRDGERHDKS